MKKFLSVVFMLVLLINISFGYEKIYDLTSDEKQISSGVLYKNIKRFTTSGWININMLTVDLTNDYVKLDLLTPVNGMYNLDTVMNQATNSGAVAAVNGEFFTWVGTNLGSPLGFSMKDGEIVSTPAYQNTTKDTLATFSLDESGVPFYQYVKSVKTEVKNKEGETSKIGDINKNSSDFLTPMVYTAAWSKMSFGNTRHFDTVEFVVKNNKVTDIRNCEEPVEIPTNGYVITARGDNAYNLKQMFKVGDKIELIVETEADMKDMLFAISGGALLVKDGSVVTGFSHDVAGYNPRTALGTSYDGEMLYLVTVDGRGTSKGVTQNEMAYLMNELGAWNAINLDGGGSTNMVGRLAGDFTLSTLNNPSENRKVINSVGVVSIAPQSSIDELVINKDKEMVFVNHPITLSVKGYDKYINPCEVDQDDVTWKVSGVKGKVKDNVFVPTTSGVATLTASYKGAKGSIEINVLGDVGIIELAEDIITLSVGETYTLNPVAKDVYGYTAEYDKSNYKYTTSNNYCSIDSDGTITALSVGQTLVTVISGNTKSFVGVVVKGVGDVVIDDFENESTYFSSYPKDYVSGNIALNTAVAHSGNSSLELSYVFSNITNVRGAYINFNEPPVIDVGTQYINFWAYSERKQPNVSIKMQILDANGEEQLVIVKDTIDFDEWEKLSFDCSSIVLPAKLERIYTAQGYGEGDDACIYIDDLTFTQNCSGDISKITIPKNTKPQDISDRVESEDENGFSFVFYKSITDDGTLYSRIANSKLSDIANNVDIFFTESGSIEGANNVLNMLTNQSYKLENSLLITLDNQNAALTTKQWVWFVEEISNRSEDNIFIVLRDSLENAFKDNQERQVFTDIITKLKAEDKNVIVLYFGDETGYNMYNGFKEFSINVKSFDNVKNKVDNDKYIKFIVNDDEITYQVLSIYE